MKPDQLIEIIKSGKTNRLTEACLFEDRLRGHTETRPDASHENAAICAVHAIAAAFLPEEKVDKIKAAIRPPMPSNDVIDSIYTVYESIFNGKNPSRTITSPSKSFSDTLDSFLKETNAESIFDEKAFGVFKNAPNALMVVDAPAEGGKAYISFQDVSKLFNYKAVSGVFEYAIFEVEKGKVYAAYTQTHYIKIVNENGIYSVVSENEHGAKACPVRFFWTDYAQYTNQDVKATPVTNLLSALDMFNYYSIAQDYNQVTQLHPITIMPQMSCGYSYVNGQDSEVCNKGILVNGQTGLSLAAKPKPCPNCSPSVLAGAGSVLAIPQPMPGAEQIQNPVQFVAPPLDSAKHFNEFLKQMSAEIMVSATGKDSSVADKLAINETQVNDTKESRESILKKIALNISKAKSWAIKMLLSIQFRTDQLSYVYNLGTEFYTLSESQLIEKIKKAKESGLSYGIISELERELSIVRNRHNPTALNRQLIIESIEPFPSLSFDQINTLSPQIALSKCLFPTWLANKEVEIGGSLGGFVVDGNLKAAIDILKEDFITFVKIYETNLKSLFNEQKPESKPASNGGESDPSGADID